MVDVERDAGNGFAVRSAGAWRMAGLKSAMPGRIVRFVDAMRVRLFHDEPDRAMQLATRWLTADGQLFVEYDEPVKFG